MHTSTSIASEISSAASHTQVPSSMQQQVSQLPQAPMAPQLRTGLPEASLLEAVDCNTAGTLKQQLAGLGQSGKNVADEKNQPPVDSSISEPNKKTSPPIAKSTGRDKHLAWAKERALDYVNQGDLQQAVASMISDLGKHPATAALEGAPQLALIGLMAAMSRDTDGVRRWIKGFN